MITKYGVITDNQFQRYKKSIVNRIYAILPMKEEGVDTIPDYIYSLNRELVEAIDVFDHCERILSVICILQSLVDENNHSQYRKEVLHCCNIVVALGSGDDINV